MKVKMKMIICSILAIISIYIVGRHVGLVIGGNGEYSLLEVQFIGLLCGAVFFTTEAVQGAIAVFSKKASHTESVNR